ncbi:cytochrome P450 [Auricularia subglabra TFB-10046 SS5]|nr:cytochrome P450 [Auricularia subglabra TFB-10046 SS5]
MPWPGDPLLLLLACIIAGFAWVLGRAARIKSKARYLPGPSGIPLLGNILDVPTLAKKYGPIFQLKALSKMLVIVNNVELALELLDKRGSIYSDRPAFHMADAAGWEWDTGTMHHSEAWRLRRRLVHQAYHAKATSCMHGILRQSALELAQSFMKTPDNFRHHIRRFAAANIMKSAYGIHVSEENDPYVEIAETAMDSVTQLILPGSNPVDVLPFLRHIPAWVPVLGYWMKKAESLRKYPTAMVEVPYERTREDIKQGIARPCLVTENLESMRVDTGITEEVIKDAAAVAYLGGSDSTPSTLLSFVMAMVLWPEWQAKAQAEIDRVLGDRLPEFSDQDSLPLVEALTREVYRRFPVLPLAVPHAAEEDDVFQGMLIRKGTIVIANTWAILHDERAYPDPHEFNPDRYLHDGRIDPRVQDPRIAVFGFGRRICPGRHFADASVFISIAMLLKCFTFRPYVENGVEILPSGKMVTGIVSATERFRCTINPRSASVKALLDAALEMYND